MLKYIFVDVDGVLNPVQPSQDHETHLISVNGLTYTVYLNPKHGKMLLTLGGQTDSVLVWGTTWENYANEHIGPKVGLPRIGHLELHPINMSESLGSIKARAAECFAQGDRFVYFDDERDLGEHFDSGESKHIWVDPKYGLTNDHLIRVHNYLLS